MTTTTHALVTPESVLPKRKRTPERARFLAAIVTTALEGGIGYWSQAEDYRWWDPELDGGTALHEDGICNAYAVICDQEGDDPDKCYLVTVDDVARALGILRKGPVKFLDDGQRADIVAQDRANGDDENHQDIDATLADCIVQVALFGEVVYG